MRNYLRTYDRVTNCCFIFSLQAGVVIIGVLGIAWTSSSLIRNIFSGNNSQKHKDFSLLVAIIVLILILGGHILTLLSGSWAHINLSIIAFSYNSLVVLIWIILSALSYANLMEMHMYICIEGRCPDVLWLYDSRWRYLGDTCPLGAIDPGSLLNTRPKFSMAQMTGYERTLPDYVHQPGLWTPCYEHVPGREESIPFSKDGITPAPCPVGEWLLETEPPGRRGFIKKGNERGTENQYVDYYDGPHLESSGKNLEQLNATKLFNITQLINITHFAAEELYRGCEVGRAQLIVQSLAFCMFFTSFFLYGRAIEFNYYHELIMPFGFERD